MHRAARRRPGPLLLALVVAVVVLLAVATVAVVHARGTRRETAPRLVADRSLVAPRPEVRAAALLRRWDAARAEAWADADPRALGGLYVVGSAAGRRDQAMLGAWSRRGLRVQDLRTQVVRVRVLAHRPGRFELEVVDRVVAGTAVGAGVSRPLPRDGPSTRRVVLVEQDRRWLVGSVSAGPSAARP